MRKAAFTAAVASGVCARQGEGRSAEPASATSASKTTASSSSSNAAASSSSTKSTSSLIAQPSSTSSSFTLSFNPPPDTTTCGAASFTWSTAGTPVSVPLTIQVMNATMAMSVLTQHVPITASRMDWHPVDVDVGTYTIVAWDANRTLGIFAQSAPFNVTAGADRSCLATLPAANASSASESPSAVVSQQPSQALVVALCLISAALLVLALAACGFVFRRYYYNYRQTRRRPGGPRYLF